MFCKCFFAALWESVRLGKPAVSKVRLRPIYLPAEGFLVEADGYFASIKARFHQARRHCQGVAELSYVVYQYINLMCAKGISEIPSKTHAQICGIMLKMGTVHIVNSVQAMFVTLSLCVTLCGLACWFWQNGLHTLLTRDVWSVIYDLSGATSTTGAARVAFFATFGPLPPVAFLCSATSFIVLKDVFEGRYKKGPCNREVPGTCKPYTFLQSLRLFLGLNTDMGLGAQPVVVIYGFVPEAMASWSLFWYGSKFDYIVAEKPK